ncbi:MAG: FAD-binding protein [Bacteroidetes bacterium]|nr:FAD-binding protein [Bacteroidota bacterium]
MILKKGSPFTPTTSKRWSNFHQTISVSIQYLFTSKNPKGKSSIEKYNAMTQCIQETLGNVILSKTTVRAFGSGWSWTPVNTTPDGIMIDTSSNADKGMNLVFDLPKEWVKDPEKTDSRDFVFCQCGLGVKKLNSYLEKKRRSLKTSGASDGQTIVGAFSTGTHGSNPIVGAIHNCVAGLHIVTGPNPSDHVWIQKKSAKVVSDAFLSTFNINTCIEDDDVFNAAVVGIGGIGFIHGVLLETESLYQLKLIRQTFLYNDKLINLIEKLDISGFGFPDYQGQPMEHLQVVFDPYAFDVATKTGKAIVTYGYKLDRMVRKKKTFLDWLKHELYYLGIRFHKLRTFFRNLFGGIPNDIIRLLSKIDQHDPEAIPATVATILKLAYKTETQIGTLGEIFTGEGPPSALAGSTMFVNPADVMRVLEIFQKHTPKNAPEFAGVYSLRYVRCSDACLGGNFFKEVTCGLEADGILNDRTKSFYHKVWSEMRAKGIPFRFHLGKLTDLDQAKFTSMYGSSMQTWKSARDKVLPNPDVKKIFTNEVMKEWGLD